MDKATREKYLALLSENDKERLSKLADKARKGVKEFLNDILTLSVTTKYQKKGDPAARTDLYFDGDIEVIVPKSGEEVDQQTLDLHQKMVGLAMKNRRELIRLFAQLFDLKDLVKLL
jgi:hypothetical protein